MDKKIIGVLAIIGIVAIGIGVFALNGTSNNNQVDDSNNNKANDSNDNQVDEIPESPEYIGKAKAIEIWNNRDPSASYPVTFKAGSIIGVCNATDAKLIKNEDGIVVYEIIMKDDIGIDARAYINAKTGEII